MVLFIFVRYFVFEFEIGSLLCSACTVEWIHWFGFGKFLNGVQFWYVKSFNWKKNGRYVHDCGFYELCVYPKLFFGKLKLIPMLDGYIKICSVYCNDNKIKNILINYKIFGNCNHINQISLRNCAVISVAPHFSTTSTSFWCTLYIFNTRLTSILITNQL